MALSFQQLRTFHAIASERSMTRAAAKLGVSQPTLSKQLKELQERHSVQLFTGNRAPFALTSDGEALVERTRILFAVADDIEALLAHTPPEEGGLLRIGSDSPQIAVDVIARLSTLAPKLEFKVLIANATETNRLLMAAQVDLAIVCQPLERDGYTYRPLCRDRLMAVLPVSHRARAAYDWQRWQARRCCSESRALSRGWRWTACFRRTRSCRAGRWSSNRAS